MAHIRQVLANLSISVSEFKKSPKTVIKAVKNEPIAVIINDKPAFYCVPADILESLYQKFYEMNDMSLQNMQDLNNGLENDDLVNVDDDDDSTFGVNDIFQSIEDEQQAKLSSGQDIVDPLSPQVSDPLDEEVAYQLNSSIDKHLMDSAKQISSAHTSRSMSELSELDDLDELNDIDDLSNIDDLSSIDSIDDINDIDTMRDLDMADFKHADDISNIDGVGKSACASLKRKLAKSRNSIDNDGYNAKNDPMLNPTSYQKSMEELNDLTHAADLDDSKVLKRPLSLKKHGSKKHHLADENLDLEEPASVLADPKISYKSFGETYEVKAKHKHHHAFANDFDDDLYSLKDFKQFNNDKESERLKALAHIEELERLASLKEEATARLNRVPHKNLFSDGNKDSGQSLVKSISASRTDAFENELYGSQSSDVNSNFNNKAANSLTKNSFRANNDFSLPGITNSPNNIDGASSKLKKIKKSSKDLSDILNSYNIKRTGDTKALTSGLEADVSALGLRSQSSANSLANALADASFKTKKKSESKAPKEGKASKEGKESKATKEHKEGKESKKAAKAKNSFTQSLVNGTDLGSGRIALTKANVDAVAQSLQEGYLKEGSTKKSKSKEKSKSKDSDKAIESDPVAKALDIMTSDAALNNLDVSKFGDVNPHDQSELLGELCGAGILDGKLVTPLKKSKKDKSKKKENWEYESAPGEEITVESMSTKAQDDSKPKVEDMLDDDPLATSLSDSTLDAAASLETNNSNLSGAAEKEANGEIQNILEHLMSKSMTAWHEGDLSLDKISGKKGKKAKAATKKSKKDDAAD